MDKKLKILELTNYSAGVCGVWSRVLSESEELAKKFQVRVFSSNAVKGAHKIAKKNEKIGNVDILRHKFTKVGGESFMYWEFKKDFLKYNPDIVIAHSYRHIHTKLALIYSKITKSKVFLVTHAPFSEDNSTRSNFATLFVKLYDNLIGSPIIKKFDGVITITKWEEKYLKNLGLPKEKIFYIPNGVSKKFFTQKKSKEENKILFLGRISPIKSLETLIKSIPLIKNKSIKLEIVGPSEEDYIKSLKSLVEKLNLNKRVIFSPPIFEIKEKIKKIDSAKIFVLPSKREGMPQSLIEAMAREKTVISTRNPGSAEIIKDGKNGHLFNIGNSKELASKINLSLDKKDIKLRKNAKKSVEQFSWDKIRIKLEKLLKSAIS